MFGFDAECIVMCRAVLDAEFKAHIPTDDCIQTLAAREGQRWYGLESCLGTQFNWNFLGRFCVSPLPDKALPSSGGPSSGNRSGSPGAGESATGGGAAQGLGSWTIPAVVCRRLMIAQALGSRFTPRPPSSHPASPWRPEPSPATWGSASAHPQHTPPAASPGRRLRLGSAPSAAASCCIDA